MLSKQARVSLAGCESVLESPHAALTLLLGQHSGRRSSLQGYAKGSQRVLSSLLQLERPPWAGATLHTTAEAARVGSCLLLANLHPA